MEITVSLFYHLREKAGVDKINMLVGDGATIRNLKDMLENQYPALRTHLDGVLILMNQQIVLDGDRIKNQSHIQFLTPVGGG
jgi:molybdopterin converting factor small subunit